MSTKSQKVSLFTWKTKIAPNRTPTAIIFNNLVRIQIFEWFREPLEMVESITEIVGQK